MEGGHPDSDQSIPGDDWSVRATRTNRGTSFREHLNAPLFRNAYALVVNTGITAILGFVYWVLAARLFSTNDVGLAAAAISAMTLLAGISLLNLEAVLVRFIPVSGDQTRRLVLGVFAVCTALAVITSAVFITGISTWAPSLGFLASHLNGIGFIAATLAWVFFVLLDGILVGLGRSVWAPGVYVAGWIAIVHASPVLIKGTLRYAWVWKHVGIVDYIQRNSRIDLAIDALPVYHSWPGFFGMATLLTDVAGLPNALAIASWSPFFFEVLFASAVLFLVSTASADLRLIWLGVWFYSLTNGVGQDYFAPQAMAYFFYLVILATCL